MTETVTTSSYDSLAHSKWDCKYHIVFIPKCRKKALFGQVRKFLGPIFRELARHKECEILEGKMMPDHVHMLIKIPPKYAIATVIGVHKGKKCNSGSKTVSWKKAKLHWGTTMGSRLCGFYGRIRSRNYSRVYQEPRTA